MEVLCLLVVDQVCVVDRIVVSPLDVAHGICAHEYVVIVHVVRDGGGETEVITIRREPTVAYGCESRERLSLSVAGDGGGKLSRVVV